MGCCMAHLLVLVSSKVCKLMTSGMYCYTQADATASCHLYFFAKPQSSFCICCMARELFDMMMLISTSKPTICLGLMKLRSTLAFWYKSHIQFRIMFLRQSILIISLICRQQCILAHLDYYPFQTEVSPALPYDVSQHPCSSKSPRTDNLSSRLQQASLCEACSCARNLSDACLERCTVCLTRVKDCRQGRHLTS